MNRLTLFIGATAAIALLASSGCGDEPSSVAKVPTFKKGANVRFINVSGQDVEAHVDEQEACRGLGFGEMSGPRLTALGEHELRLTAGAEKWTEKVRLESGQTLTVFAYGSKPEFAIVEGDTITPPAGEILLRAINMGSNEKVSFTMTTGGNEKSLGLIGHGEGGESASVSAGSYTLAAKVGDKVLATADVTVSSDQTHTIVLGLKEGKPVLLVIHNNPLMIPAASGASGA